MKASEIVDKLKSVLLSSEEEPQVELSVEEVEVNDPVMLEDMPEDEMAPEDVAEDVAEEFIDGVLNERFEILPGEAAIQMKSMRENPDDIRGVTDMLYKRARRKTKRKI